MAYLVTGGTGFTGSYVVRDLVRAGKEVVCFDISDVSPFMRETVPEEDLAKVKVIQGSIDDIYLLYETIKEYDIDLIVHLAYALYPASEVPRIALQANCIGTNNVFEAARLFNLRRIVWTSSMAVFGRMRETYGDEPMPDDAIYYKPTRLYGACKILNEVMADFYFDRYGVDSIGLRLGRIYGMGKLLGGGGAFTRFLRDAALNVPVTIQNGSAMWPYAYPEDVASAVVKACEVPTTKTKVFNLSDGDEYNGWQLAEVIKKVNPNAKVAVEPGVDVYNTPKFDITGIKKELGWSPQYTLEKGLREIFNYFRQQEGLPLL